MAKSVGDKTADKARAKQAGGFKSALSRSGSRVAASRPTPNPKGTVSTKPHGRVRTFLREVRIEMTKVTWPARKDLIQATGVVIVAVVIAGIYIGVLDFIWNIIMRSVGLG
ncbi:MAG: preprotein translocase subunit SecE [Thermoleophilia bacterium]|jgi:preprotein translocase subunit SecE